MRGFDLDQLRTLVAAVDAGSLSAAAPARALSQSSLSEQLRKLEDRAGQTLLLRGKSGVQPTAAGERLLVYARQILALSDSAWRDMHDVRLEGEVSLAITEYFRPADLARLLARLGQRYPGLRLRTHVGKSDDIELGYRRGAFDLAVVMQVQGARAAAEPDKTGSLHAEPLVWVGSPDLSLVPGQPIPLALLPESCSLHRLACAQLDGHGIPYVIAHVASGVAGLRAAIEAGLGVACLNASALDRQSMMALPHPWLPALPEAWFVLLPLRHDETREPGRLEAMADVMTQALAS